MEPPPCVVPGTAMNNCAKRLYAREVENHIDLDHEWAGWKIRRGELITPDRERINARVLAFLIYRWRIENNIGLPGDGPKQDLSVSRMCLPQNAGQVKDDTADQGS